MQRRVYRPVFRGPMLLSPCTCPIRALAHLNARENGSFISAGSATTIIIYSRSERVGARLVFLPRRRPTADRGDLSEDIIKKESSRDVRSKIKPLPNGAAPLETP